MAKKDSPIKLKQDAEAAEKKGDFAKAIELFKQLVQDNPRDWNTVNRIGDLYAKLNKLKEANDQYVKYASYLADDGFYLKSIAVWKKVLKNDPSLIDAQLRLGDLYHRQGLVADAKQTFSAVYDEYKKRGKMREASEALKKWAEVDPGDLKVRIGLAQVYAQSGNQGKAADEYVAIADELVKKGKLSEALQVIEQALKGPRSPRLLSAAAQVHIVQKDFARAIELLEEARRATPTDREIALRLAEAFLGAKRPNDARRVLESLLQRDGSDLDARQQLGQVYLTEGRYDEAFDTLSPVIDKLVERRQNDRATALLQGIVQRHPQHFKSLAKLVELYRVAKNDMLVAQTYGQMVEAYLATGGLEQAASILDMLVQLEPHNEQHRTKLKWLREQKGIAPGSGALPPDLAPALPAAAPAARPGKAAGIVLSPPPSPEDQEFISEHLAEGRVFRKYGLGDKAKDQFEAVLGRFPDNLEALQELYEISKEKGDNAATAQKLRVMAEVHRLKGEADKAAKADAEADALVGPVAEPAPAAPAAAPAPAPPTPPPAPAPVARAAPAPIAQPPVSAPPPDLDMDISVEEPQAPPPQLPEDELQYVEVAEAPPDPQPEFEVGDLVPAGEIGGQFLDEEPTGGATDPGFDLGELPPPPAAPPAPPVVTTGLRPQAAAPAPSRAGIPADLKRSLDEIESYVSMGFVDDARGVLAEVGARFAGHPALVQRLAELGLELEAPSEMDSLLGDEAAAPAEEPASEEPLQLGADFLEFTPSTQLPQAPPPEEAPGASLGGGAPPGADGDNFDFASELGGLFGAQPAVAEEPGAGAPASDLGDASLADIFREFQKGVDKQLGKEDYETRYNLGIAYKEMGLVDEAIAEFQLAAKDEGRLLECASMLGICFVEKGMPKLAVKWFEKGLQAPGRSDEEYQGLRYDLASALEQAGETDRARALFSELYGQDATFRDVRDKVRQLGG